MNRRGFLGTLIGGVATTAAVRSFPFRVFSFPETIEIATVLDAVSVRFIRQFCPLERKIISRFDALYGLGGNLDLPKHTDVCKVVSGINGKTLSQEDIDHFKFSCAREYGQMIAVVPTPARMKSYGSKQIYAGWDVEIA